MSPSDRRGFTIVELLVTIAVIAALLALLMVGLQAARRTSLNTKQGSDLKQVFTAWSSYANNHGDAAIPGFMDDGVQNAWRVSYKAKDGTRIPAEYARTYPWRLLPYLDHSFATLYGYLEKDDDQFFNATDAESGSLNLAGLATVASEPAFGYNAYYLGGWWKTASGNPTLTFGNATWNDASGNQVIGRVVATRVGNVGNPSRMIAFSASTFREPGFYKDGSGEFVTGSAWVVPNILAGESIWQPSDGSSFGDVQASIAPSDLFGSLATALPVQAATTGMQVNVAQGVPLRRYGAQVGFVHVDGSVAFSGLGDLLDQRRWMNPAEGALNPNTFTHSNTD
jgi:prepilin-type N-terminal cleavage/methylation domain-containing protein